MKTKQINQYDDENYYMFTYRSIKDAAKITGISKHSIKKCCSGRKKTAGGYIWAYV